MRPKDWVLRSLDAYQRVLEDNKGASQKSTARSEFTIKGVLPPADFLNVLSGHDVETLEHTSRSSSSSDVKVKYK